MEEFEAARNVDVTFRFERSNHEQNAGTTKVTKVSDSLLGPGRVCKTPRSADARSADRRRLFEFI